MNFIMKTRLALCAGVAVLAGLAQATMLDATILIDRAANNKTLTVKYDGALATLVELRINGVSVASRSVSGDSATGETTFGLDLAALEDGKNQIEIRLYDKDGKLLGTQKSEISVDRAGTGPVSLERPRTGETVQGPVEIKLSLKTDLKNIYVSFFINDEFKALKNFPPYTYMWDTTRMANGWHEVQAWVVDEANQTFKTEKVRLFVNNPGGRTSRQPAETTKPVQGSQNTGNPTVGNGSGIKPTQTGSTQSTGTTTLPPVNTGRTSANTGNAATGTSSATKPETIGNGRATGTRNMRPTDPNVDPLIAMTTGNAATKAATTAAPIAVGFGKRLPNIGTYDIFLNGNLVNFDVSPRVAEGIPLTPFRHLFEANGGKVKWNHEAKEVDAEGQGHTVWFRIGDANAKVNNQIFKLEMPPFLEAGRAIVPLSFMTDALNVKISYDPNTGHVLILNNAKN